MSKIVIVSNTYFQLIAAIRVCTTIKKEDSVDLVISDRSNGFESIVKRIEGLNVFNRVFFVKNKSFCKKSRSVIKKAKDIFLIVFGKSRILGTINVDHYDELFFYNYDLFNFVFFAALYRNNRKIEVSRYEEGVLSYYTEFLLPVRIRVAHLIRNILGWGNLKSLESKFYCYNPALYHGTLIPVAIPQINPKDRAFIELISRGCGLDSTNLKYEQKYIYFSSVYDFEGGNPVGEIQLVKKIADKVGRENVLVKVHPRDDRRRFENAGLIVDSNSDFPWEIIQLNYDFTDHVFITLMSGSALGINLIVNNPTTTFFLYHVLGKTNNHVFDSVAKDFDSIRPNLQLRDNKFFRVPKSLDEFYSLLEQL